MRLMRHIAVTATTVVAAGAVSVAPVSAGEIVHPGGSASPNGLLPVVCPGVQNSQYSPGLTLQPRNVTVTSSNSYLCGATSNGVGQIPDATCVDLSMPDVQETVHWQDDGSTSKIDYETAVTTRVAEGVLVTMYGEVVAGRYANSLVQKENLAVSNEELELECLTEEGLTHTSAAVELTIFNLL